MTPYDLTLELSCFSFCLYVTLINFQRINCRQILAKLVRAGTCLLSLWDHPELNLNTFKVSQLFYFLNAFQLFWFWLSFHLEACAWFLWWDLSVQFEYYTLYHLMCFVYSFGTPLCSSLLMTSVTLKSYQVHLTPWVN